MAEKKQEPISTTLYPHITRACQLSRLERSDEEWINTLVCGDATCVCSLRDSTWFYVKRGEIIQQSQIPARDITSPSSPLRVDPDLTNAILCSGQYATSTYRVKNKLDPLPLVKVYACVSNKDHVYYVCIRGPRGLEINFKFTEGDVIYK